MVWYNGDDDDDDDDVVDTDDDDYGSNGCMYIDQCNDGTRVECEFGIGYGGSWL